MSDQKRNSASYLHPPPVLGKECPQPHELPRGLEMAFADGLILVWGTWLGNPSPCFPHPDSFTTGCFATDKLLYPLLLFDFKWRIQFPVSNAQQGTLALEASKGKKKKSELPQRKNLTPYLNLEVKPGASGPSPYEPCISKIPWGRGALLKAWCGSLSTLSPCWGWWFFPRQRSPESCICHTFAFIIFHLQLKILVLNEIQQSTIPHSNRHGGRMEVLARGLGARRLFCLYFQPHWKTALSTSEWGWSWGAAPPPTMASFTHKHWLPPSSAKLPRCWGP